MSDPVLCIRLEKKERDRGKLLTIAFAFETDAGRITFKGDGSLEELIEMLPIQIQNAGATYHLVKILQEMEAL